MRERVHEAQGLTPLQFMLKTLRDTSEPFERRYKAAVDAAPYVHPRLANVQVQGDDNKPIVHTIRIEAVERKPEAIEAPKVRLIG